VISSTAASTPSNLSSFSYVSKCATLIGLHLSGVITNHDKSRPSTAFMTNVCANTAVQTYGDTAARSSTTSLSALWFRVLRLSWSRPIRHLSTPPQHKPPSRQKNRRSGRSKFLTRQVKLSAASLANDSRPSTHSCQMHHHHPASHPLAQVLLALEHRGRVKALVATKAAQCYVFMAASHL
jgi:hypothetical protein